MESGYLRTLSACLKHYRFVLIYGAGGVAGNLLTLLEPYIDRDRICIVVSKKKENADHLAEYPVRQIDEFIGIKEDTLVILAVMPRLAPEIEAHIRDLGFHNSMRAEEISKGLYEEIWQAGIDRNKIVFSSWAGGGFGGNAKYIALDLLERSQGLDLVWVLKSNSMELPDGIRGVLYGTYEHYWELGTACIWVDNEHKNFFTQKREGQYYLQTWHGGGPLKKIEFDGENIARTYLDLCEMNAKMVDLMISPSRFNSRLYRTAFHYTGEILECGYPRNDILWKKSNIRQKIERLFDIRPEELIALYAPSFRESRLKREDILDLADTSKAIEKRFEKGCRMFVRFHPSDSDAAKGYPWPAECIDATSYDDVQELLAAAEILITDYSSIMWDFSLKGKPVFLYHPDADIYRKERGYYLPFSDMPYVEAFDEEDLCRKIEGFNEEDYRERVAAFVKEYGSFDRGNAAKAVGDRIRKLLGE